MPDWDDRQIVWVHLTTLLGMHAFSVHEITQRAQLDHSFFAFIDLDILARKGENSTKYNDKMKLAQPDFVYCSLPP